MTAAAPVSDLYRKLQIRPPARMLILGAPTGFAVLPTPTPNGVELVAADPDEVVVAHAATFEAVICPVRTRAEVAARAAIAIAVLRPGGLLWFAYPKRDQGIDTDINRDQGWDPVRAAGWDAVRQVALDDTWSALRFRPDAEIRRKPDSTRAPRRG